MQQSRQESSTRSSTKTATSQKALSHLAVWGAARCHCYKKPKTAAALDLFRRPKHCEDSRPSYLSGGTLYSIRVSKWLLFNDQKAIHLGGATALHVKQRNMLQSSHTCKQWDCPAHGLDFSLQLHAAVGRRCRQAQTCLRTSGHPIDNKQAELDYVDSLAAMKAQPLWLPGLQDSQRPRTVTTKRPEARASPCQLCSIR